MTNPLSHCPELTINGEPHRLKLTLGALAEIEQAIGGGDFEALKARLANPSVNDLILILHALIGGGGGMLALEVLRAADIDLSEASAAVAETFKALSGETGGAS